MDSESLEEELIQRLAQNVEKRMKRVIRWLRLNSEWTQNAVTLASDHDPTVLSGAIQPLRAGVAPGQRELLPPITPAPLQQQQPCSSSSSLPACVQGQDPVLMNLLIGDRLPKRAVPCPFVRKNLTGLDFAHPLKPLIHKKSSSNKTIAPPVATKGDSETKPALQANPPTAPTMLTAPAPPHTGKPVSYHSQFITRLPRLKKAASLSVATEVATKGDTDVTEQRSEKSVEAVKTEEVKGWKEEKTGRVMQTRKAQQTRELPELAKMPPVACPKQAILEAFRLLREDDWEKKVEALTFIRSLSQHHPEVLLPRLHEVCLAVNREVNNLRSMVSCAAMETLAQLFANLGREMDAEAEGTAKTVLPKAGEASGFIREDVELVLSYMVLNVTPSRSMNALINTGLRHRNAAVRKAAAQHLEKLAKVMGASRVLSGKKDLTDRFVHSISCLALDSAQEVRTHARNTLAFLASHPGLIRMVDKFAPQTDQVAVKDIINKCQRSSMDSESLEEELIQRQAQNVEKRAIRIIRWLRINSERTQNTVTLASDHDPTMPSGAIQPLRAGVAPGRRELLPPITPAPLQQQQPCSSSSSLPACVQGQDPVLMNLLIGDRLPKRAVPCPFVRKNLTGLDFSHPLKPLIHKKSSSNKTIAPPVATKGDSETKPALQANPPTAPTMLTAPAPPHTGKSVSYHSQFTTRLPRLKKAALLSVATEVATKGDTDVTEQRSEKSVEAVKTEEVKGWKEEKTGRVMQTRKAQQTRELPELAKMPPVACPKQAILEAFRLLREDDWEKKVEALTFIRTLSQHHAEVLLPRLHEVCLAVNREVNNLRSMVSCAAMETLAQLFANLGREMDAEAEGTAKTVLPKAGEASGFIREDVELVLSYMVLNVTASRSMNALINTGLRHRNAAVRKAAAQHLEKLAKVMGASRVLSGKKDLTDRFVHSISCLALDSAQEVRTHARNTLAFLASHPGLIRMVDKFAPQTDQVAVKDIINKCQRRNLK